MAADVGTGTSITFASGFFAEVLTIDWSGISRVAVDTSHLLTTIFRTKIPGDLTDPGEIAIEIQFEPDTEPPWDDATETATITFPLESGQTTPATWAASAFLTDFGNTIPLEEKMTASSTLTVTGAITVTAAT